MANMRKRMHTLIVTCTARLSSDHLSFRLGLYSLMSYSSSEGTTLVKRLLKLLALLLIEKLFRNEGKCWLLLKTEKVGWYLVYCTPSRGVSKMLSKSMAELRIIVGLSD